LAEIKRIDRRRAEGEIEKFIEQIRRKTEARTNNAPEVAAAAKMPS
jgi:hypothetical protein